MQKHARNHMFTEVEARCHLDGQVKYWGFMPVHKVTHSVILSQGCGGCARMTLKPQPPIRECLLIVAARPSRELLQHECG